MKCAKAVRDVSVVVGVAGVASREIVEAHDLRIGFSSQPGVGFLFWFELRAV